MDCEKLQKNINELEEKLVNLDAHIKTLNASESGRSDYDVYEPVVTLDDEINGVLEQYLDDFMEHNEDILTSREPVVGEIVCKRGKRQVETSKDGETIFLYNKDTATASNNYFLNIMRRGEDGEFSLLKPPYLPEDFTIIDVHPTQSGRVYVSGRSGKDFSLLEVVYNDKGEPYIKPTTATIDGCPDNSLGGDVFATEGETDDAVEVAIPDGGQTHYFKLTLPEVSDKRIDGTESFYYNPDNKSLILFTTENPANDSIDKSCIIVSYKQNSSGQWEKSNVEMAPWRTSGDMDRCRVTTYAIPGTRDIIATFNAGDRGGVVATMRIDGDTGIVRSTEFFEPDNTVDGKVFAMVPYSSDGDMLVAKSKKLFYTKRGIDGESEYYEVPGAPDAVLGIRPMPDGRFLIKGKEIAIIDTKKKPSVEEMRGRLPKMIANVKKEPS